MGPGDPPYGFSGGQEQDAPGTHGQDARATGGGVSERVLRVAEMFGIGLDEGHEVVLYEALELEIRRGDVVSITGASGRGKSALLRAVAGEIGRQLALGAAGPGSPRGAGPRRAWAGGS